MTKKGFKKTLSHLIPSLVFLMVGLAAVAALTAAKPDLKKRRPKVLPPMVLTHRVETGPVTVRLEGEGTVQPLREINLVCQVGGKVVFVSPDLVNGGSFSKGEILLRVNQVDYKLAIISAQSQVSSAESSLEQIKAEAAAALEEWRRLRKSESNRAPSALLAKKPQLAAAEAGLEAARAELMKARINLARTEPEAPFDGVVSQKNVDLGQYVSPGQTAATIFSTEAAEIVVPFDHEDLFWFSVPGFTPDEGPGSAVEVRARIAGRDLVWPGRAVRVQGRIDQSTRMAQVVVRVEKPYSRKPPLAPGLYVRVEIEGRTLPDAALIPRAAVKPNDTVWVVSPDRRIVVRKVKTALPQGDMMVVASGLSDGDLVVTSSLQAFSEGMEVRLAGSRPEGER